MRRQVKTATQCSPGVSVLSTESKNLERCKETGESSLLRDPNRLWVGEGVLKCFHFLILIALPVLRWLHGRLGHWGTNAFWFWFET